MILKRETIEWKKINECNGELVKWKDWPEMEGWNAFDYAIPNRLTLNYYSALILKWWSYSFSLTWEADSLTVTVDRLRGSKWASVVKINWFMLNTRSSFSVNSRYKYLNVSASTNESILTKKKRYSCKNHWQTNKGKLSWLHLGLPQLNLLTDTYWVYKLSIRTVPVFMA